MSWIQPWPPKSGNYSQPKMHLGPWKLYSAVVNQKNSQPYFGQPTWFLKLEVRAGTGKWVRLEADQHNQLLPLGIFSLNIGHEIDIPGKKYKKEGFSMLNMFEKSKINFIRAPLERGLCTIIVPSLALATILYLYILRRTISKNHRSVRIFVPVNGVPKGP